MSIKISAALIVKDEASCIGQCLASIANAVDEIVVVDTGSTDATLAMAATFTDRIYTFRWCDDFSAARNFAINQARGDYILFIDADNVLTTADAGALLRTFAQSHQPDVVGTVLITSLLSSGDQVREVAQRFFRRDRFRYEGAIHEQLVAHDGLAVGAPTGLHYAHSGYAHEASSPQHKSHRNIRLLQGELGKHPDDDYYWYQLGKAHFALKDYGHARAALARARQCLHVQDGLLLGRKGPVSLDVLIDLVTSLAYADANVGRLDEAVECLEAYRRCLQGASAPGAADYYHCLGYVYLLKGAIEKSESAFLEAIKCGPDCECVLGTASFRSYYHLGLLSEARNDEHAADTYYLRSLRAKSNFRPAIDRSIDRACERKRPLDAALPAACDMAAFEDIYVEKVKVAVRQGAVGKALILAELARQISPQLYSRCVDGF